MPPALLRLGQVLMLLVLFATAGGHWLALQSLAWTRMLVSYSHEGRFAEAVSRTFDGRHPCGLCKKIEHARSHEQQSSRMVNVDHQALFVAPVLPAILRVEEVSRTMEIPAQAAEARPHQPLAPPPRSARA